MQSKGPKRARWSSDGATASELVKPKENPTKRKVPASMATEKVVSTVPPQMDLVSACIYAKP